MATSVWIFFCTDSSNEGVMSIVILRLLKGLGVMVEIAVGKPLFPSQTWLCSSFPCSSFISCIPYLCYSCPLPSVACSHTPGPASAVSHIILQKCKSLNTSFLYLSLFQCSERCLSPFRDFGLVTPVMHHT